jgi:hypothetical protein
VDGQDGLSLQMQSRRVSFLVSTGWDAAAARGVRIYSDCFMVPKTRKDIALGCFVHFASLVVGFGLVADIRESGCPA